MKNIDDIYLIKIIAFSNLNMYTLYVMNDVDRPILNNGKIIFFSEPELSQAALKKSTENVSTKVFQFHSLTPALECDLDNIFSLILYGDVDISANILNFLNMILDFIRYLEIPLPSSHKKNLYNFADHLTFESNFENFLCEKSISRFKILESIYWCIGAIVSNSMILVE